MVAHLGCASNHFGLCAACPLFALPWCIAVQIAQALGMCLQPARRGANRSPPLAGGYAVLWAWVALCGQAVQGAFPKG